MFLALRQGQPLYILEKGDELNIKIGTVEGVTQPRPKYTTFNPNVSISTNMETVVDITVKIGSERKQYVGVPSNLSIHEYGNVVLAESRDAMIAEVDGMLQASKLILETIDQHKKIVEVCEKILKQLNPSYAKEQERDDAIGNLKDEVATLRRDISKMMVLLTKAETT